jgi:hypothetical protein
MSAGRAPIAVARALIVVATQLVVATALLLRALARAARRSRLLRSHVWVLRSTEDGGLYQACARCGVDRGPVGFGLMTTPPWPGSR